MATKAEEKAREAGVRGHAKNRQTVVKCSLAGGATKSEASRTPGAKYDSKKRDEYAKSRGGRWGTGVRTSVAPAGKKETVYKTDDEFVKEVVAIENGEAINKELIDRAEKNGLSIDGRNV